MARSDRCFALAASALLVLTGLTASQSTVPILTDGDVKVGTILASEVEEFHVDVNGAEFRQNPYDMHIILDVIAGDCDLCAPPPIPAALCPRVNSELRFTFGLFERIFVFCD
jgi:hypothetical protein